MKTQTSTDGKAIRIFGDHSPNYITLTTELYERLGSDAASVFHKYHEMKRANCLPYFGCDSHPLESEAWDYALKNKQLGYRKWRWGTIQQVAGMTFWSERGYFYEDGDLAVFQRDGFVSTIRIPERMKKHPVKSAALQ